MNKKKLFVIILVLAVGLFYIFRLSADPWIYDYDDAIRCDKRTFCQYFWEKMKTELKFPIKLNITGEAVHFHERKALKNLRRKSGYFQEKYCDNYNIEDKDDGQDFLEIFIRLYGDEIETKSIEEALEMYNELFSEIQVQKTKKKI